MGYTDISIVGSDYAADMVSGIVTKLHSILKEEMKDQANEYNTDGIVNVALFFEGVIIRSKNVFLYYDELVSLAKEVCEGLNNHIERAKKVSDTEWDGKDYHIRRYSELRRKILKWIKDND